MKEVVVQPTRELTEPKFIYINMADTKLTQIR